MKRSVSRGVPSGQERGERTRRQAKKNLPSYHNNVLPRILYLLIAQGTAGAKLRPRLKDHHNQGEKHLFFLGYTEPHPKRGLWSAR